MVSKIKVLAAAGLGLALLGRGGRARLAGVPDTLREASRRRRLALPRGVEEFAPTMVDRRHAAAGTAPAKPAVSETPAEVVADFYQEHPRS